MLLSHSPPWALPTLTALIGSGGFIIGIYSFISPVKAAQVYGVDLPLLAKGNQASKEKTGSADPALFRPDDISRHVAYIYAHGVRNFVTGFTILSLTGFWQFSAQCKKSVIASSTAQRSLGIVILAGALTPVVDAVVTWQAAEERTATDVGKKAARAHASRSLIWIAGGLWCLFG
ncbi:hypothetical protein LTR84_003152 [Exophiala bonariae]|uniref:Uncharacterized protein n=1 Tax=Exophiala bonariae TaxID=1690606 RepID=A0AAV9NBM3_9EURO|nr:hypothetical protein LTR84_003152 [Exophiala bonariae]